MRNHRHHRGIKLYWRLLDDRCKPLTFDEAFYLATKGGREFFGKVGSFESGYAFDALVLSDEALPYPHAELTPRQRLERFAYLQGDHGGIYAKYAAEAQII